MRTSRAVRGIAGGAVIRRPQQKKGFGKRTRLNPSNRSNIASKSSAGMSAMPIWEQ